MSLFGHPTDLNRQFIARPDAAKEDILYKWPDMTIRKLTQVTVQPDETAIFFKEGKVAGILPQGRSTLDGALIPFLGDIVDWASGGNMYRAELYFVGTREFVNLPFGGPIDNIEDPETGLAVGLRVYGDYALSISDPAALILKLVGTRQGSNELITDWAREQILKALRTSVVRKLTAEKWPVLGLAARTADIETSLIADVQAPLAPYGVNITRLGNVTITLNPEDEQTLKGLRKDTAYTRLAGGFREYGVGAALKGIGEGAAAGNGGGTAALGVGMGLGGIVAGLGSVPGGGQNFGGGSGSLSPAERAGPGRQCLPRVPGTECAGRQILLQLRHLDGAEGRSLHPMRRGGGAGRQVLRLVRYCTDVSSAAAKSGTAARLSSAALAAAALDALPAWSRTGAGNHSAATSSSSSSHSGGGSFGSGGSFGGLIALIILALLIGYIARRIKGSSQATQAFNSASPQAQAALAALGSVIGAAGLQRSGATSGFSGGAMSGPQFQPAIDALRAQDPGFEMENFLQRAEMTFFLVKRGLQKNDAAAIRPYLNDPLFAELSRTIAASQSQHRHLLLESLNVQALHLQNAECGDAEQRLQVHFDLVYRAKTLDEANRAVSDEGADSRHAERWTFVRSAKAKTPISGGVVAAKCPACGAELRLALDGTCTHCRASVTNGAVDWVVAEVQPAAFAGFNSEFAAAAPTVEQGVASLQAADAAFAIDAFTTRVKAAFMALQDAWCQQKLDAGRAFMSPGAYFSWSAQIETLAAEGRRNVMENISVNAVQPIRVVHGRVFDDLTVRISAAAADFEVDKDNKIVFGDRQVRPFSEQWTFQRSVGALTSNKPGTLENTCPRCGAPLALTQIGECRYCKAAVTSGKFDWVVSRIEQEESGPGGSSGGDLGGEIAEQLGAAVVGGLLGSLLSGKGPRF